MHVKGHPVPLTITHPGWDLLRSPLDIPLPADLRLRPESIRECTQGVPHHPPPCFALLMRKAKLVPESIRERIQGVPH
jgi:hypothetical protein